jgi:hypothetical protein
LFEVIMDSVSIETDIPILGEAKIPSPVQNRAKGANGITFAEDNSKTAKHRLVLNWQAPEATFFSTPANCAAPW